jgi:flagellar basal-body rod modification protein FlgD
MESIAGTTSSSTTSGATSSSATGPKQLGQEDFLKLLVTQLKNQDPLKPIENEAFIAQLAQFSQLEQSSKLVTLMQQNLDSQAAGRQVSLVPLIGHKIKISGSAVELGAGPATMGYTLAGDASSVQVSVFDSTGRVVRSLDMGAQAAGAQQVTWDGKDQNGQAMPAGTYQFSVEAKDILGNSVGTTLSSTATVSGVRMENGVAKLVVGSRTVDTSEVIEFF